MADEAPAEGEGMKIHFHLGRNGIRRMPSTLPTMGEEGETGETTREGTPMTMTIYPPIQSGGKPTTTRMTTMTLTTIPRTRTRRLRRMRRAS